MCVKFCRSIYRNIVNDCETAQVSHKCFYPTEYEPGLSNLAYKLFDLLNITGDGIDSFYDR